MAPSFEELFFHHESTSSISSVLSCIEVCQTLKAMTSWATSGHGVASLVMRLLTASRT